jgi:hypothetical protein
MTLLKPPEQFAIHKCYVLTLAVYPVSTFESNKTLSGAP